MDGLAYAQRLHIELGTFSDEEQADSMEAYMKHFPFFGVDAKLRKTITSEFIRERGLPTKEEWKVAVRILWQMNERECQYAAMEIAEKCKKHWDESALPFFKELLEAKPWWDTVDFIASHLVGNYLKDKPELAIQTAQDWNQSGHLWLIRTSIIFQLSYKENTDWDLMRACMDPHLRSKEFFLQKAIGWALRQYARINPQAVLNYIDSRPEMANLSKREAMKHL